MRSLATLFAFVAVATAAFTPVTDRTTLAGKAYTGTCYQAYAVNAAGNGVCIPGNAAVANSYGSYFGAGGNTVSWASRSNSTTINAVSYTYPAEFDTQTLAPNGTGNGFYTYTSAGQSVSTAGCVYLGMDGNMLVEIGIYSTPDFTSAPAVCPTQGQIDGAANVFNSITCDQNTWNYYCIMTQLPATGFAPVAALTEVAGKSFTGTCYQSYGVPAGGVDGQCLPNNAVMAAPYTESYSADGSSVTWSVATAAVTVNSVVYNYPAEMATQTAAANAAGNGLFNFASTACVYLGVMGAAPMTTLVENGIYNTTGFTALPGVCPTGLDVAQLGAYATGLYCTEEQWNYYCVVTEVPAATTTGGAAAVAPVFAVILALIALLAL